MTTKLLSSANANSQLTMDARQFAPATQRNREPILAVLQHYLPKSGTILEIASGTGEHALFFAPHAPDCLWLPSDPNPIARASISAWQAETPIPNLLPPIDLDVQTSRWPVEPPETVKLDQPIRAIVNINMIHISPWSACQGLMAGAQRILPQGGILFLYGPFKYHDKPTAPSNEAFDVSLQAQNPKWGVRYFDDVIEVARQHTLTVMAHVEMPANNLSVIFQKH
jgi:hypothetical protein